MNSSVKDRIIASGFVAILRRVYGEDLMLLSDALYAGGARQMEVTFDQQDPDCMRKTTESIAQLCQRHPDMDIGAGTVLTCEQVRATKEAGGSFVISPNTDVDIIQLSKKLGLCSVPGAMTPSELVTAHNAGADIVKLFPAAWLGLHYIKDLRAPIGHIPLMATGGVTLENYGQFLAAGCCSAGIGGFLSDRKLIAAGEWAEFTSRAKALKRIHDGAEGSESWAG